MPMKKVSVTKELFRLKKCVQLRTFYNGAVRIALASLYTDQHLKLIIAANKNVMKPCFLLLFYFVT